MYTGMGATVNQSAVMAVGEEGVECGILKAAANGQLSTLANAYVSYSLLNSVIHYVGSEEAQIYDDPQNTLGRITTRYFFLAGEEANYSGMPGVTGSTLKTPMACPPVRTAADYIWMFMPA